MAAVKPSTFKRRYAAAVRILCKYESLVHTPNRHRFGFLFLETATVGETRKRCSTKNGM